MTGHIEPTAAAGRALMLRGLDGPVVMLNLLRFRAIADYSAAPGIAPAQPISGMIFMSPTPCPGWRAVAAPCCSMAMAVTF